jgi:hypothetical protein
LIEFGWNYFDLSTYFISLCVIGEALAEKGGFAYVVCPTGRISLGVIRLAACKWKYKLFRMDAISVAWVVLLADIT